MSWARVGAAALSLALTSGVMVWRLMLGVLLLVVQGFVINRLAGIPYPAWSPNRPPS